MQEINSFLTAFATLNAGYGVSNDYDFSAIGVCDLNEIKSVTQRHLKLEKHDSIHIFQLENWEEQLFVENALLPLCPNSENFWFGIVPKNIMLNGLSPKQYFIHLLRRFFNHDEFMAFRLQVETENYYACCWEEYLFYNRSNTTLYYLSYQVHD